MMCHIGATEMAQTMRMSFEKHGLPSYSVRERAVRALWALSYYGIYLLEHGAVGKPEEIKV
jgi:acyl-CoA synthetase (NDP forming)